MENIGPEHAGATSRSFDTRLFQSLKIIFCATSHVCYQREPNLEYRELPDNGFPNLR